MFDKVSSLSRNVTMSLAPCQRNVSHLATTLNWIPILTVQIWMLCVCVCVRACIQPHSLMTYTMFDVNIKFANTVFVNFEFQTLGTH